MVLSRRRFLALPVAGAALASAARAAAATHAPIEWSDVTLVDETVLRGRNVARRRRGARAFRAAGTRRMTSAGRRTAAVALRRTFCLVPPA
jgi:hypothetical protein